MEKSEEDPKLTVIKSMLRQKMKIFTRNEEALHYCNALKVRSKVPYKYIIVTWDE